MALGKIVMYDENDKMCARGSTADGPEQPVTVPGAGVA
jgi:hypothetical protein